MNTKLIFTLTLIVSIIVNTIICIISYQKLNDKIERLQITSKIYLQKSDTIMTLTTDIEKLKKDSNLYYRHLIDLDGQLTLLNKDKLTSK
jgi:hypothetical protein